MTYAPLAGGWLTGKYKRNEPLPDDSRAAGPLGRMGTWNAERQEVQKKYKVIEALSELAKDAGYSLAHMALAFAAEHPSVSSVIIGPKTFVQAEDNLAAAELRLSADVLDRIDEIVPPGTRIDPKESMIPIPSLDDPSRRRHPR